MRRLFAITATLFLIAGLFSGCGSGPAKNNNPTDSKPDPRIVKVDDPKSKKEGEKTKKEGDGKAQLVAFQPQDKDKQEQYDAALTDALTALADRKWDDALKAFEAAQKIDDTDFVKSEIARLKSRIELADGGKNTVKNIETILADGKAEDALKLIAIALREYGDGDDASELVKLRIQAEALKNAEVNEGKEARYQRFRKEGKLAMEEKNLRAAALAYEQALLARDDAGLQDEYKDIRDKLEKYDTLRKQASELRRDPARLEDALDALKQASAAWDTLVIRDEIDQVQLALTKRRDNVSVANFEVRNDVGMGNAGAVIADELLPRLKAKFNLVDRASLNRALTDLEAPVNFADDPDQRAAVAKLADVRYLVVGSVSRLVNVTVRARLIDVRTGVVMQTAKVSAPTMAEVMDQMPNLARQLLASDVEDKEADLPAPKLAPDMDAAKPAPELPAVDAPLPAAPVVAVARPAINVKVDVFRAFKPAPADFVPPEAMPLERERRNRLLAATLEIGDFLFRARRFGEARRQFEFALILAPGDIEVHNRLVLVNPFASTVIIYERPRIAVLPFGVYTTDPLAVPGYLSWWTPTNLSPYFSRRYDVVDPMEIYWYMGRMGLTMQDVLTDANARRWLGRAAGVRYFLLGSLVQTGSFDANTYLLDAELGVVQSAATINVRDPYELRMRLPELAELTMMTPAQQLAYWAAKEQARYDRLVADGRRDMDQGRFRKAANEFREALTIRPYNGLLRFWLSQCESRAAFQEAMAAQQARNAAIQAQIAASRQRQIDLALQAEIARKQAIAQAAARSAEQQRLHIDLRVRAQNGLITQAQFAMENKRFGISISLFRGAQDLTPPGAPVPVIVADASRDFARAQLQAENAAKLRAAELKAVREATLRKAREEELAKAANALKLQQQKAEADLTALRLAQAKRDEDAYKGALAQGQKYLAASKFDAALASFQAAQRFKNTNLVMQLIEQTAERKAVAAAATQKEKDDIQNKLQAARNARVSAAKQATKNDLYYATALKAAQEALILKNFDVAEAKFRDAEKIFATDAVKAGLKQVESGRAARAAELAKTAAEAKRAETIKQLLASGNAALANKKFGEALQVFKQAKKLAPENVEVLTGLAQAELGARQAKIDPTVGTGKDKLKNLITTGLAALKLKDYDAAEKAFKEARLLDATNPAIVKGLKDIADGRKALADAKTLQADFQAALNAGQKSLLGKKYEDAIKSFQLALRLMPDDPGAAKGLKQAQIELNLASKAIDNFNLAMAAGEKAMKAKNYKLAVQSFMQAKSLFPDDVRAEKLLRQAQQALADAAAEAAVLATYQKAMTAGQTAMSLKKYDLAITSFKIALKTIPGDPKATQQLALAEKLLDASKVKMPDPAKQFLDAMQRGAQADKDRKFAIAVKSYQEAVKLRPKDSEANFGLHMAQGQAYLEIMQWMAAQKEFEAALRIAPGNPTATKLLQKAKMKMK